MIFRVFLLIYAGSTTVYTAKDKCVVTENYITFENYEQWPASCTTVCGNLAINNSKTNLTEKQLASALKNLKVLYGILRIEFTNFSTFNKILPNLRDVYYGIIVGQNSELSDLSVLKNWNAKTAFVWHIALNPKLDFSPYCEKQNNEENVDFNAYGNLKSCGCLNVRIGSKALAYYPNCTTITGGLKIQVVNSSMNWTPLYKLTKLSGNLEISETDLEDLAFLQNLETIDLENFNKSFTLKIFNNTKLKRLGMDSLKSILPKTSTVILANNHPDFCLNTYEFQMFVENHVKFEKIQAKFCANFTRKDGQKVCKFENLEDLETDCEHLIGDVKIDSENENLVDKLGKVTNIYGSLTVENTEVLEDLNFLGNLKQVASLRMDTVVSFDSGLDKSSIIQINYNKKLLNISLPNMTTPPYPNPVIEIFGNSMEIFTTKDDCFLLQNSTGSVLQYNGKSCENFESVGIPSDEPESPEIEATTVEASTTKSGGKFKSSKVFIIFILVTVLH